MEVELINIEGVKEKALEILGDRTSLVFYPVNELRLVQITSGDDCHNVTSLDIDEKSASKLIRFLQKQFNI